jgi:hypothetical protein
VQLGLRGAFGQREVKRVEGHRREGVVVRNVDNKKGRASKGREGGVRAGEGDWEHANGWYGEVLVKEAGIAMSVHLLSCEPACPVLSHR